MLMRLRKQIGFTLIELISVMVVLGIVMLGVTNFIATGIQIYVDVSERDQLLGDSRFVVERLNRELRNALPNSVRVAGDANNHCIEFVPIRWSTFYEDIAVGAETASGTINAINLVGITSGDNYIDNVDADDFVIVYGTEQTHIYETSQTSGTSRKFGLAGITNTALATITLDNVVQFATDSPMSRLYVIDEQTVSYCLRNEGGNGANSGAKNLYRVTGNYGLTQTVYSTGGVLMAENIDNALSANPASSAGADDPFRVYENTLQRNSFTRVRLRFKRNDEIVEFNNEVHIPNTP